MKPDLCVLKNIYAIYQLDPDAEIPSWIEKNDFYSITGTSEELSIICRQADSVSSGNFAVAKNRKIIKADGPLDISLTGIIAGISGILAKCAVPVFTISTYNTDYILVEEDDLEKTVYILGKNGYKITFEQG